MLTLFNGEPSQHPLLHDRALHYGDGLFETITLFQPIKQFSDHPLYDYHLKRLAHGIANLLLPADCLQRALSQIDELLRQSKQSAPWILKLVITRGKGQRGYPIPEVQNPNIILIQAAYPKWPQNYNKQGIRAEFSPIILQADPLPGIKHCNRLLQVLASQYISEACQEAILLSPEQYVIEGTKSNLFAVYKDKLLTPCLKHQGVAGVARAWILDYCQKTDMPCHIEPIHKSKLLEAEHIFVCNSVIGLWPVTELDNKQFAVGHWVQSMQLAWGAHIAEPSI